MSIYLSSTVNHCKSWVSQEMSKKNKCQIPPAHAKTNSLNNPTPTSIPCPPKKHQYPPKKNIDFIGNTLPFTKCPGKKGDEGYPGIPSRGFEYPPLSLMSEWRRTLSQNFLAHKANLFAPPSDVQRTQVLLVAADEDLNFAVGDRFCCQFARLKERFKTLIWGSVPLD